jgi:hypothetical protein
MSADYERHHDPLGMLPDDPGTVRMGGMNISSSDLIKLFIVLAAAAVQWGFFTSEMNSLASRLDKHEVQESVYLRADVQTARNEVIMTQLKAVVDRLDRIDSKLDTDENRKRQ